MIWSQPHHHTAQSLEKLSYGKATSPIWGYCWSYSPSLQKEMRDRPDCARTETSKEKIYKGLSVRRCLLSLMTPMHKWLWTCQQPERTPARAFGRNQYSSSVETAGILDLKAVWYNCSIQPFRNITVSLLLGIGRNCCYHRKTSDSPETRNTHCDLCQRNVQMEEAWQWGSQIRGNGRLKSALALGVQRKFTASVHRVLHCTTHPGPRGPDCWIV